MEPWKDSCCLRREASWTLAIRTEDTGHVSKLCVKTLFISENFILINPNFVAFIVSLGT